LLLAPIIGGFCRFEPSCSRYAEEALRRHGAARGTLLTVKRLMRCQPFHRGGFDPVP
jgi:putative membrane protein insertion efficiency factor